MNEPEKKDASGLTLKAVKEFKLPTGALSLDLNQDASTLYAACIDGSIVAVEVESGDKQILGEHESYASSVARIPGSDLLLSGGYDGTLRWHRAAKPETTRTVAAHKFWSWQTAPSPDGKFVASVTGQYLCGGYKYEPMPEREPSVRIFDAATGAVVRDLPHVPPVQSVAFSADSRFVAAGNLMGEVRVWELTTGQEAARFTTPSFTGWGIIKGHYYTGGIFALHFAAGDRELYVAGMGSTTDPAAGNGKQLWQRFDWREGKKLSEAKDGDLGRGLMETLAFHPSGSYFVMAGRLENGKWTMAFFDTATGAFLHGLDTKSRVTKAMFDPEGKRLFVSEALGQGKPKDGKIPDYGRISIYSVARVV